LRILVYEYVSGGGYAGKPLPLGVLSEGYSMLRGAAEDFGVAGHEVAVLLDARIAELCPSVEADVVLPIKSSGEADLIFKAAAQEADAVLVVAPEACGVLQSLVETVNHAGALSLNCTPSAIEKASNKVSILERLKQTGLQVPRTVLLDAGEGVGSVEQAALLELSYPIVVKPLDGAGCSGVNLVRNKQQLEVYLKNLMRDDLGAHFLAQELIQGVAASVSLVVADGKASAVSLNSQNVTLATPDGHSSYMGGTAPLEHPMLSEGFAAAEKAVSALPGVRGYEGVDMILTESGPVVLEVNPRLTTSYVGLRKVAPFNLAQAMLDAASEGKLPERKRTKGYASFSKVTVPKPSEAAFKACCSMDLVVSPPFPLGENGEAVALVQSHGETPIAAALALEKAKKQLLHTLTEGA
jgi:tyramine---L-glutamate ligase